MRIDEVVLKSLEKEPDRRYQHASEVKSEVDTISSTMPPGSPVAPAVPASEQAALEIEMPRRFFRWFAPAKPAADASAATGSWPWETAFGLFCVGWLATKMLWNFGTPGCWLASLGMAALVTWLSLKRMQIFSEQCANWYKRPRYARTIDFVLNMVFMAIGFTFLIGGIFNFWEQYLQYTFALSAEQYEAEYKGKEYHLLQSLPAFSKDIPNVEMLRGVGGWTGGWLFGWSARGPGHHWNNVLPNLFVGCVCVFLFSFVIVSSCQFPPETKRWPILWRHVRASLGIGLVAGAQFVHPGDVHGDSLFHFDKRLRFGAPQLLLQGRH